MPIDSNIRDNYSHPFVVVSPKTPLRQAMATLQEHAQPAKDVFLVVYDSSWEYYWVIRLHHLVEFLQKTNNDTTLLSAMPLQSVDKLIKADNAESPMAIKRWLNSHPQAVVLVVDENDNVIDLLYVADMSGRAPTHDVDLPAAPSPSPSPEVAFREPAPKPPTCPYCTAENFFRYVPESGTYICPNCGRVTVGKSGEQKDRVKFTGAYPREVYPEHSYGLHLYAHTEEETDAVVEALENQDDLGWLPSRPRRIRKQMTIERGTILRVRPELDYPEDAEHVTFQPPVAERIWNGETVPFDFKMTVGKELAQTTIDIRLSVQIEGIEVASQRCQIDILAEQTRKSRLPTPDQWTDTAEMYDRIFISYSREDTELVRRYWRVQRAIGNEVFLDTEDIRSGIVWKEGLARAISSSDYMQLFWSEESRKSKNVEDEWRYALENCCPENRCQGFIRPVYWEKPIPEVPEELKHLNFRYEPFESISLDSS